MTHLGLDVGSRTIVLVALRQGVLEGSVVLTTGINPLRRCKELLSGKTYGRLVVTGYGRHLVAPEVGGTVISEIRAYAVGARKLYPDCQTVIDIGGQDSKLISLSIGGEVQKFEMNDRCAAGTGKFLEIMANTLEVDIGDLGTLALGASKAININSLCTVFAESEVVSLIAKGEESSNIALALHEAIANRIASMARRVGVKDRVVFAGGAALNPCLHQLLSQKLRVEITVPDNPQTLGAFGAALIAEGSDV
ncbi:MAG: acyl-CoA dehydratase activase [Chloroflexi bacterium]|nr:acyl-CoA dehydratase activase [Chloroflexota bacterium]